MELVKSNKFLSFVIIIEPILEYNHSLINK